MVPYKIAEIFQEAGIHTLLILADKWEDDLKRTS